MKKEHIYLAGVTIVAALGGFLFGFDMAVISGAVPLVKDQFNLTPIAEGWFVSSALAGAVIGVAISGELSDRLGRRTSLILSAVLFLTSAVGCTLAPGFTFLIIARIIGGIGVGIASNVVPLYLSEIAPAHIRGSLVTCYQLAITVGILVAYISNAWLLNLSAALQLSSGSFLKFIIADDSWRSMFGLGAIPAILFGAGLFFVPESPRWLFQKDLKARARSVMDKIYGKPEAESEIESLEKNREENQDKGSYRELLKPGLRKALLIGILLPIFSQFSGINAVIYYGPRILKSAGFDMSSALTSQIILGAANMLFTFIAIWYVDRKGRRPLYIYGTIGATISLFFTGLCFYLNAIGSVFLLMSVIAFLGCFAFSIGPLKFVVASEIFPNRIRGRALALSIMTMWIADMIVGQITPMLLASVGTSGTFWFFTAFCFAGFWVVYFLVPETKDKTLEEIENMWKEDEPSRVVAEDKID